MSANDPQETCWTVIEAAAGGKPVERQEFALRYSPVVAAYLKARWRNTPLSQNVEDAAQDVFVECLKPGGAIQRADRVTGDFRTRKTAMQFEICL